MSIVAASMLVVSVAAVTPSPANAESMSPGVTMNASNVFEVYVGAGENLDVSILKAVENANFTAGVTVTVERPFGGTGPAIATCTRAAGAAVNTGCSFANLTSTVAGIWKVTFTAAGSDPYTWTINVQNGATNQPGRVFTETYSILNATTPTADISLWYQGQEGYLYRSDYDDYNGVNSVFTADGTGNRLAGTCVSAYKSYDIAGPYSDEATYDGPAPSGTCGDRYKIFFAAPSAALPISAIRADGTTTWLKPPITVPAVGNMAFTPTSNAQQSGTISMDVTNFTGQATLTIDANGDGDYTDPVDRSVPIFLEPGTQTISFDGLDGLGNPIPASQQINTFVQIDRTGEVHFVNQDVENRGGGVEITRLNGPAAGTKTLYWDDTDLRWPDPNRCGTFPVRDGTAGVDSTGGVHLWTPTANCATKGGTNNSGGNQNNGIYGSWGDARLIDDWTYVPVNVTSSTLLIPPRSYTIAKVAEPAAGTTVLPGGVIEYSITITNTGVGDLTDVVVTDDLTAVVDDATVTQPTVAPSSSGAAGIDANNVMTFTGDIPAGQSTVVTYTATVDALADLDDAMLLNGISSPDSQNCRPPVITDPDHPSYDPDCSTNHTVERPALTVVKSASPNDSASYDLGQLITYTFVLTNVGNVTLTDVEPVEGEFTGTGDMSDIVCEPAAASMAPGAQAVCTATYTLTQADINATLLTNTVTATGTPPVGPAVVAPEVEVTIPGDPEPGISLVKTVDPAVAGEAGDSVTYSFLITNTGNVSLTDVTPIEGDFDGTGDMSDFTCPPAAALLLPGQQVTCTATYVLTQADADVGQVTNTATATGTPPGPLVPPVSPPDGAIVVIPPAPALTLVKTADPTTTDVVGATIAYSFVITNTGNVTLTNVHPTETSFSGSGTTTTPVCEPAAVSVAPGDAVTCTASYVLTQADVNAGEVTNVATATGTPPNPNAPPPVSPPGTAVVTIVPAPSLTIVKTANPTTAGEVGEIVTYTFLITNTGNVTLTDVHPTESSFTGTGTMTTPVCGAAAASLVPTAQVTCTSMYVLTQADVNAGVVDNAATATGTPPDPNTPPPVSPPDPATVVIPPDPAISIVKSATPNDSASYQVGQMITYRFVATNEGNVTLTNVVVEETAFSGTGALSAIVCPGGNGTVTLASGQQVICTATYTLTQADIDATSVTNVATATGRPPTGPPVVSPPDELIIPGDPEPGVSIAKSVSPTTAPAKPGATVTYTFVITNTGDVTLTDVHPTETDFSGDGAMTTPVCEPAAASIIPGQSATCTATYTLTQGDVDDGLVTNAATATGTPPGNLVPPVSEPDDAIVVITPDARISIVKSAAPNDDATFNLGQVITYTFLVTNEGNVSLDNVTVVEQAFNGSEAMSAVNCPGGNGSFTLTAGQQVPCTATYTLTQADIDDGSVTNVATATGIPPTGPGVTSPPDEVTIPGDPQPGISLVKTADPATGGEAGDTITYSFLIRNTGNVTLTDVEATEGDFSGTGDMSDIICPPAAALLVPGQVVTCTATYTLTQADVDEGEVTNAATATGIPPGNLVPPVSPPGEAIVIIPPAPAVAIVKTADPATTGAVGATVTYTFVITNTGNVTLTDVHPTETSFTGTGTMTSPLCGPEAASMAPGDAVTCTASYTLTQADVDAGAITNVATGTGTPPDPQTPPPVSPPAQVTVIIPPAPGISVVKTANPATVGAAGETVVYSFLVTNTGNVTLTDVTVTETGFTGTGTLGAITCNGAANGSVDLAAGAQVLCTANYNLTQADVDAGKVDNTATATGTPPPGVTPPVSPPSTATVTSTATGQLTLVKTAAAVDVNGNGITDVGDQINWTLIVTNIGTSTVTGISVSDPTAGLVTCPATTLAPGASMTCTAPPHTITAQDAAAGGVHNVATATGTGIAGGNILTPPAEATIAVQAVPPTPPSPPPATTPNPSELPATGSNSTGLLRATTLLGLLGLALVSIARRRKRLTN